jgi:hypothetical protein
MRSAERERNPSLVVRSLLIARIQLFIVDRSRNFLFKHSDLLPPSVHRPRCHGDTPNQFDNPP